MWCGEGPAVTSRKVRPRHVCLAACQRGIHPWPEYPETKLPFATTSRETTRNNDRGAHKQAFLRHLPQDWQASARTNGSALGSTAVDRASERCGTSPSASGTEPSWTAMVQRSCYIAQRSMSNDRARTCGVGRMPELDRGVKHTPY